MNGVLPLPRLRQSKESLDSSPLMEPYPSSDFVRELPVPPLREWSPAPRLHE
ncbi:Hypothetical protein FKW44_008875 [Caligus rogercresseyi]|uniref:Uncharacterized protein n=1 Tax=Caligus rogercresseyi TaxID=217165 RepID=A0A7T8K724_CALRO|nr:Hypothetical protein FKW44_008875 [Caligus rogercresseyi]